MWQNIEAEIRSHFGVPSTVTRFSAATASKVGCGEVWNRKYANLNFRQSVFMCRNRDDAFMSLLADHQRQRSPAFASKAKSIHPGSL
jgi:hypothetical protein